MKVMIEQIKITSFGKLKDFTLDLKDGFNVIYGENESGKSTIQLFIKAMLYGMPSRKKADEALKERERAIPWDENKASGVLILSVAEKKIEIRRSFGKTSAGDKFEVCDAVTGEPLSEYTAENIGEKLFGIPLEVFERTLFIRQSKTLVSGRCDELSGRLMNLKTTGDESVSAESAIEKLEKEKRSIKAKDKRSAKGRVDELLEKIDELKREKIELLTQLSQTESAEKRLAELKAETEKAQKDEEELKTAFFKSIEFEKNAAKRERLKRIDECDAKIKELGENPDFEKGKDLDADLIERAQALEKKILEDKNAPQSNPKSYISFGICAALIIAALFVPSAIATSVLLIIGAVFAAFGVKDIKNAKTNKKKDAALKEIKTELFDILNRYGANDSSELLKIHTTFLGIMTQIESLKTARAGFLGSDTYDELKAVKWDEDAPEKSAAELEKELSFVRKRLTEFATEQKAIEIRIDYETRITKIPADYDTEIIALSEEIEKLNQRYSACEKAQQIISEAQEVWKAEMLPQLNESVNSIIERLTAGKYQSVRVLSDYRMRFNSEDSFYDAEYLSFGTHEQIYLSLRLAMAELICEGLPVFLDDILTSYDDERTKNAIEYLGTMSGRQIILFTCHKGDAEFADKTKAYTFNI